MTARIIMRLRVVTIEAIASDVKLFSLRHAWKPRLPAFVAGAHVDVRLPGGKIRQYSLCGDPQDHHRYEIAVKREAEGRGGSQWMHSHVVVGDELHVSAPRNNFSLTDDARHQVFIGGGIGVTALVAMAMVAQQRGQSAEFHYCARSPQHAPLHDRLEALLPRGRLRAWFSQANGGRRIDLAQFKEPRPGVHLYCCGPDGLVAAVREATASWPAEQIHFEVFKATLDENFKPEPFDLKIRSSGEVIRVPADRSALQMLAQHGYSVPSSCEAGVCGACVCEYQEGEVIHRDAVLGIAARQSRMMLCVSRARVQVTVDL